MIRIENILLLEPDNIDNYYPFSVMHPLWELRVGCHRLFEKIKIEFPDTKLFFQGRKLQTQSFHQRFGIQDENLNNNSLLIINSKVIPTSSLWDIILDVLIQEPDKSVVITKNREPIIAWVDKANWVENLSKTDFTSLSNQFFSNFKTIEKSNILTLDYLHEAILINDEAIKEDSKNFKLFSKFDLKKYPGCHALNSGNVYIGQGVKIYPTVVLDATEGPIIINRGVKIMPHSTIIGPCYIGSNSTIKVGAKIYEKTSIGEFCKVGGEVENTIFQSYSNKQHDGFLGHSFISEWVNLGADTNNSDLKNTYQNISLRYRNELVDTKTMFMGLLCGDHTKTAINTRFNTGTTTGIAGMVFNSDFPPSHIKSFSWGGMKDSPTYKVEKAIQTARIVMQRRQRELSDTEIKIMENEYHKVNDKKE